eukprot:scaffold743_cov267-Pinguiococcus_pyrenoidosus.AAC.6
MSRFSCVLCALSALAAAQDFHLDVRPDVHLYELLSPKLRITGSGFSSDFSLTVVTDSGQRTLWPNEDFVYTNSTSSQITLKKMAGKHWANTKDGPATMFLNSFVMDGQERLENPVVLATVIPEPMVFKNSSVIFLSETKRITLRGANLKAKVTKLMFSPPLKIGVDYSQQVVSDGKITITLLPGKQWRSEPGPLKLVRVDTGAGPIRVTPPGTGGLLVAEVQADVGQAAGVVVIPNLDLLMYQTSPTLSITGAGFNLEPEGQNLMAFANGIRGQGLNFTVTGKDEKSLTLTLAEGSKWRQNPDNLPGPLLLLSLNIGKGWVPLGSTRAKRGRVVARIFETPTVNAGEEKLYLGQTTVLKVQGAGFVQPPNGTTTVTFDPPIDPSQFSFDTVNSKEALVMLENTGTWRDQPGPLSIRSINTGPGDIVFDPPVKVADVVAATATHASGITVSGTHSDQKIYADQKEITVSGTNFLPGQPISVEFKPGFGPEPDDFDAEVVSADTLKLTLKDGKEWCAHHTVLLLKTVVNGEHTVDLVDGEDGIAIATAFPAPEVTMVDQPHIYASHSKKFYIHGFFGDELQSVQLSPSLQQFDAGIVSTELIELTLHDGGKWAAVAGDDAPVDLKLVSMDLGAGPYLFPDGGVVIADVYPDSDSNVCDDSCMFANNGMCEDGSDVDSWQYDDMDDDLGFGTDDLMMGGDDDWYTGEFSDGWTDGDFYDDYDGDDFMPSFCDPGTDCTDCGGTLKSVHTCDDTCKFAMDFVCDDPRGTGLCELGSDCHDCGEVGEEVVGKWDALSDGYDDDFDAGNWFDDDDAYLNAGVDDDFSIFTDDAFAADIDTRWDSWTGADGKTYETHSLHPHVESSATAASVFVVLLQAVVYSIGIIVAIAGGFVIYQMYKGSKVDFPIPDEGEEEGVNLINKAGGANVPITPDETSTNA